MGVPGLSKGRRRFWGRRTGLLMVSVFAIALVILHATVEVPTCLCLWRSGDIWDAFPGFPLFDLHLDGKTDSASWSEIIVHSSLVLIVLSVSGRGYPSTGGLFYCLALGLWSSVRPGFGRVGSVALGRGLAGDNPTFLWCQLS